MSRTESAIVRKRVGRTSVTLAIAGIMCAAVFGSGGATRAAAADVGPPTFGEPTVSGIQGTGFEQDIRLAPDGTVYTSAPGSLSSATSFLWRSLDKGKTFKWVPGANQPSGKLPTCVGGGDTELATDSANNLYFIDLTLANFTTARSEDRGRTFLPLVPNCASVPGTVVDRQWYAVDGNPRDGTGSIFLVYDILGKDTPTCPGRATGLPNELQMTRSPVAGVGADAGLHFGPAKDINGPCDEGIMGNDEFFNYPGTGPNSGKRVFVVHDNDALNKVLMGRCDVVAFGPPSTSSDPTGLANCKDFTISDFSGTSPSTSPQGRTGANFPTMAVDRSGNLFAVWEQAPYDGANVTGNTRLMFSTSHDQGATWAAARQLPTDGLHNNVFAWPAAGDNGRIDVAWYGTPANCDSTCVGLGGGPDHLKGDWSLFMTQTLDGGNSWTQPILASEHFIHRGNIQTLIGKQSGDRTLGDFLQMRIGAQGEANISYADSNNIDETFLPHSMYVRQNGGASVLSAKPVVNGSPAPRNSVTVGPHDATFDNSGASTPNQPNLEILGSSITKPDSSHYQVKMNVADLRSLVSVAGPDLVWQTQWHVPSLSDPNGGKVFFVYMESTLGGSPTCWSGESAANLEGGGAIATYPGATQITGSACSYTAAAPGTITITVPSGSVAEANPINDILYSVTASTQSLPGPANTIPSLNGVGGTPPNLIDVAPAYDFNPALGTGNPECHEGDGQGNFQGKNGTANFQSDEDNCEDNDQDSEQMKDSGGGADFRATSIQSIQFDDALRSMTIYGQGVDKAQPVTFLIVEQAANGLTPATYTIQLSDGYTNSGTLTSGSIGLQ